MLSVTHASKYAEVGVRDLRVSAEPEVQQHTYLGNFLTPRT